MKIVNRNSSVSGVHSSGVCNVRRHLVSLPTAGKTLPDCCSRIYCLSTSTVHGAERHGWHKTLGQLFGRRVIHNIALIGLKPQNLAPGPFLPSGSGMSQGIEHFCGFFRCLWCEVACLFHQLAHLKPALCSQPLPAPFRTMLQHRRSKGAFLSGCVVGAKQTIQPFCM